MSSPFRTVIAVDAETSIQHSGFIGERFRFELPICSIPNGGIWREQTTLVLQSNGCLYVPFKVAIGKAVLDYSDIVPRLYEGRGRLPSLVRFR
ncbi:hypothetical protein HNQ99_002924 [Rhizorhapis suberifaciens]|uniref:Uncharacterized protein n=1 Tax=Rhizorhapis suberifaciens TaxID=13656 RepID=A0A840HYJ7_9SPHN|nr:hypothetical protein [Rhizorhapis suberifaciens]